MDHDKMSCSLCPEVKDVTEPVVIVSINMGVLAHGWDLPPTDITTGDPPPHRTRSRAQFPLGTHLTAELDILSASRTSMCSQEYISVECNVCGTEYSHYKPRSVGFEQCRDSPCRGLTKYTTAMQGGTCAACIMEEKRAEQDRSRGPAAAEERRGSAYGGY